MKKLPVNELLRLACIYAEGYQENLAVCWGEGTPEAKEAMEFVRQVREYRMTRWGKTALEDVLDKAKPVSVEEVCRRAKKEGKK